MSFFIQHNLGLPTWVALLLKQLGSLLAIEEEKNCGFVLIG